MWGVCSVANAMPEFQSGLDALTKFAFERTKPKQVRGTIMTGPILAGITKSYVDALNDGAAPSLFSSWQVGEAFLLILILLLFCFISSLFMFCR